MLLACYESTETILWQCLKSVETYMGKIVDLGDKLAVSTGKLRRTCWANGFWVLHRFIFYDTPFQQWTLKYLKQIRGKKAHSWWIYMSHLMTKPTKWHMRPAKTQISLGICPVWSESSLCTQCIPKLSSCGQRRHWSDWADAQADLSLHWVHMPFCWFCREAAHI